MDRIKKLAEKRAKDLAPPDLNCLHDGAYNLQEGIPLRYCPNCQLLTTGALGRYSIYMHPDVLKDLERARSADGTLDWASLHLALTEIGARGEGAGERV